MACDLHNSGSHDLGDGDQMNKMRIWLLTLIGAACMVMNAGNARATVAVFSDYSFSGLCSDCTGHGTGLLVLQNYTPGTLAGDSNFVSFDYSSNLISYSVTSANLSTFSATLASLPGEDDVTLLADSFVTQFTSQTRGFWCTGAICVNDIGASHVWSVATVPEPVSLAILGVGLAGLGAIRRRRV
jgi:hypothetical protein